MDIRKIYILTYLLTIKRVELGGGDVVGPPFICCCKKGATTKGGGMAPRINAGA